MVYIYIITVALAVIFFAFCCFRCCFSRRDTGISGSESSLSSESSLDSMESEQSSQSFNIIVNVPHSLALPEYTRVAEEQQQHSSPRCLTTEEETLHFVPKEEHLHPPQHSQRTKPILPTIFHSDRALNSPPFAPSPYESSYNFILNWIHQTFPYVSSRHVLNRTHQTL
ncbi:uncharacterized protein LOC111614194 [Centruroides sculpturatus]|uniref:uncharacterized protein LOC111614194 n=1 Tax=Centruroides sculpturatus TaxID=218467 RepID=UPI000C6CA9A6|nr:uncharacterized protein LOC111614194 [Centruroides sculpturatus]XP_023211350.1 uncharacterized protein LOC111614194 [Centruroides sculpturatus]XP_023211354.1 uncharacterized protein LOC111614194 [Centruroides sculpturatus]